MCLQLLNAVKTGYFWIHIDPAVSLCKLPLGFSGGMHYCFYGNHEESPAVFPSKGNA